MMFCPKCGSIMMPKKDKNEILFSCSCGHSEKKKKDNSMNLREVVKEKRIESVDEEPEIHPLTNDSECPKCGSSAAYYWEIQTRASDEPATKFLKCQKCKHIWRDYK